MLLHTSIYVQLKNTGNYFLRIAVKFFFNVYLFLEDRQSISGEGAKREGDTESEADSRL